MPENTARIEEKVKTDGSYEAPTLYSFDDFGKKARALDPTDQTSGRILEEDDTLSGKRRFRHDLPLIRPQIYVQPSGRFQVLKQYEGMVISIEQDTFWARLVDKTKIGDPDEEGEFPIDEVSPSDRRLIKEGAVFYWYIGYHDSVSGQRKRQSVIRFRRLPVVTEDELDAARQEAKRLMAMFHHTGGDERFGDK